MSHSILFIGTSFLGAVKQGWEASIEDEDVETTFIGLNAPGFVANLARDGWSVDGERLSFSDDFECFVSGEGVVIDRSSGSRTFPATQKVTGFTLDLAKYKAIVFVDMFYRLKIPLIKNNGVLVLNGRPVSRIMLKEMQIQRFNGWVSINNHPLYGDVPWQDTKYFVSAVRRAASDAQCFLVSAPRPPQGNADATRRYGGIPEARACLNNIEEFYTESLSALDIQYLRQPEEVLDADLCFTDVRFSRGAHPSKPDVMDEHMNQAYGEEIARNLLKAMQ